MQVKDDAGCKEYEAAKAADRACQPVVFMISSRPASPARCSTPMTIFNFENSRGTRAAEPVAVLAVAVAVLGVRAFRAALGAGCGVGAGSSFWTACRTMRVVAAARSLNFFTCVTPASMFQIAARRAIGQAAVIFVSWAWVANATTLACAAGAAAWAVMLLSLSIV